MQLTTKSRYAIIAMVDLALQAQSAVPISLADIASRQNIAIRFLEQIFSKLKKAGLVNATKGPGGGYHLARNPEDINLLLIINAVEENIQITMCKNSKLGCNAKGIKCLTHDLLHGLEKKISEYFVNIDISDLCNAHSARI
jgi:Rrf2 family iron-sulfur cluster assembly transcriptional regulator